jgi:flagellar motor switch protein FliN/FliY
MSIEESVHQVVHYFWILNFSGTAEAGAQMPEASEDDAVQVMPAEFGPLTSGNGGGESDRNVEMLMDVELEVAVEIDRKMMLISDLLKLGKGSIVELEKSAGEPLDIFVNGRKFAEGEVVVVDDRFGIRITQMLSPKERVKSLG